MQIDIITTTQSLPGTMIVFSFHIIFQSEYDPSSFYLDDEDFPQPVSFNLIAPMLCHYSHNFTFVLTHKNCIIIYHKN